ncbi:Ficolin-1 [Bulinus truncatus]|nr:Ficolin-1 [Bulinus truncatus]
MEKGCLCEGDTVLFTFLLVIFGLLDTAISDEPYSIENTTISDEPFSNESTHNHYTVKKYPMLKYNPCEEVKLMKSKETPLTVYTSLGPIVFLCDTVTDNGGWVIFQKRGSGQTNFSMNWFEYAGGFGSPYTEFWLGNELLHQLTSWGSYELRVEVINQGQIYYAKYREFKVHDADNNYRLVVEDFSEGNLEDKLSDHNGDSFSTPDRDNDETGRVHCARTTNSGWWFHDCGVVNLNGVFGANFYRLGAFWEGLNGGATATWMKMRIRKKV